MATDVEAESAALGGQRSAVVRFARDIAVNVIANLVAAAVIYLVGATTGLLPRSSSLIFGALSVILLVAAIALLTLSHVLRGTAGLLVLNAAAIVLGVSGVVIPFARIKGNTLTDNMGYLLGGLAAIFTGVIGLVAALKSRSRQR